jgi:hypothetical protein
MAPIKVAQPKRKPPVRVVFFLVAMKRTTAHEANCEATHEAVFGYEASLRLTEKLLRASLHASVASASWRRAPLHIGTSRCFIQNFSLRSCKTPQTVL